MSGPDIWPFHCRAFLGDTEKLSAAETGAYIRLLIFYWHNRGLPTADDELRNITGLPAPAWKHSRAKLQSKFQEGWRHERADRDLAYVAEVSAKNRANVNKRWEKNTGDKKMRRVSYDRMNHHEQNQSLKNKQLFNLDTNVIPKERIDRTLSISGVSVAVDKRRPRKQDVSFPKHELSKTQRAEQAWQSDLLHDQGPELFAITIDRLSADPGLVERATVAEMDRPGSGAVIVMLELSAREVSSQ